MGRLSDGLIEFEPRYPLWSDRPDKRRWPLPPPGGFFDASGPDARCLPPGTRLWKQLSHCGRRIETRLRELLADGRWRYASQVWNEGGTEARLAPAAGTPRLAREAAPDGRYAVPSQGDCHTCHAPARAPVLGFASVHLADALPEPVRRGLVRHVPAAWRDRGLVIVAADETEAPRAGTSPATARTVTTARARRCRCC
jgi:hypothetical protein